MWNNKRSMMTSGTFKQTLMLSAMIWLTACGGLTQSNKPAASKWLLKPYDSSSGTAVTAEAPRVSVTLSVVPGLDTDKILTLSSASELGHFAGARWVDNLPELLDSTINRSLKASGRFNVVPSNTSAGLDACSLSLEVQKFYATGNQAQVAVAGDYTCKNGESVPIQASASTGFQENRISTIVAAFQTATDKVTQTILTTIP